MENGVNFEYEEYSQLTVRFTKNKKHLLGSGTLYVIGEEALVLTAAHVIWGKKQGELFLSVHLRDKRDMFLIVKEIHIHEDYSHDDSGTDTENDAAILVVEWEEWMKDIVSFRMADPLEQSDQILYGYPGSEAIEEENGRTSLSGKITDTSSLWYVELGYDYKSGTSQVSRSAYMQGFSGGSIYQITRNELIYSGAMSGGSGAETAGNKAKVTRASLFCKLIEEKKLLHQKDIYLKDYIEDNIAALNSYKDDAIFFYRTSMEELIENNIVKAEDFLTDGEDRFKGLVCQKGHRNCARYWQGQLTCSVCVYSILEEHDVDIRNLTIRLNDSIVHVMVLCTEEPVETLYHEMLTKGYFSDNGIMFNDTILLWANPKDKMYMSTFPKKYGQRMVKNIVSKESCLRKSISGNRFKEIDIIKGRLEQFNIGMLGLGKINIDVIDAADGDFDQMKGTLLRLINEVL